MRRQSAPSEIRLHQLPRPSMPQITAAGFAILPITVPTANLDEWICRNWVYMKALEQAMAATRPSLIERDLLGYWN
jgi:hypothetical protein